MKITKMQLMQLIKETSKEQDGNVDNNKIIVDNVLNLGEKLFNLEQDLNKLTGLSRMLDIYNDNDSLTISHHFEEICEMVKILSNTLENIIKDFELCGIKYKHSH